MATSEDTMLATHRYSLLDAIEDRNRGSHKKSLVHAVFLISRMGENVDRVDVGSFFDKYFKERKNDMQTESITGLMLIYMKHIVHVLESTADVMLELIKELVSQHRLENGIVAKSKILVISHDYICDRQYQCWNFRILDIVEPGIESYDPIESGQVLSLEMITQLMNLGKFMSKQPKMNLKNTVASLHEKVPDLLPQQAVIRHLLADNDSCVMTTEEYVQLHELPYDVVLDSDLVWPLDTRQFPYQ